MEEIVTNVPAKNVVGVKFKRQGKIYSFEAGDLALNPGDQVIVETDNGLTVATVASAVKETAFGESPANMKKIVRKVLSEDLRAEAENRRTEKDGFAFCASRIAERQMPMKLVEVECLFDKSKIIFYFTAENRVDFRDLVKDLVQKFKTRIELRQIGVRNETRICGGLGICGRELCCSSFLQSLDTVSVKMAKEQNMLLNPEKISGLCGRLMCCLAFEYESYRDLKKNMPKVGKMTDTPQGRGKVIRQNILKGKIAVHLEDGREVEVTIKPAEEENNEGEKVK
jgi:cell fate regulator YaaT (PSP1 superfamily)